VKCYLLLILVLLTPVHAWAEEQDYLYYRDVNVPAYQTLREFFDLPNRPGRYEVTLVSDAFGPLTFSIFRVYHEKEVLLKRSRSYKIRDHEFQVAFPNPHGDRDLIVEIANSNPAKSAKVSVYVVELP